ncbi:hypothetical protein GOBAR_AA31151 [Gossypium barbadense]|uniref:Uncharacterized protein n=1 Tax=Gossypium barbadense TaxID=3634 RepID=A0A2P5WEM1_GOSBA|nr:hypothetical protein GOBAR_AA31151 [Gossypium barbadense]
MSEDDEWQQSPPSDLEFVSNKARDCNATGSGSGHPEFQSTYPDQQGFSSQSTLDSIRSVHQRSHIPLVAAPIPLNHPSAPSSGPIRLSTVASSCSVHFNINSPIGHSSSTVSKKNPHK